MIHGPLAMRLFFRTIFHPRGVLTHLIFSVLVLAAVSGTIEAAPKKNDAKNVVVDANLSNTESRAKSSAKRYPKPGFYGKNLSKQVYRGMTLIGAESVGENLPSNEAFYEKVKDALDLIHGRTPDIFALMRSINTKGRRVIYYTGKMGPASFAAWKNDYVVNITASNIEDDPAFENTIYSLSATLVHELVGHGRQEADGRLWIMYDWCGKSSDNVKGVVLQANHKGASSGLVEYEANLFAKWFLESVRGTYPDLNEPAVRRYVKLVRIIKHRFPGWYDDRKTATTLLAEFEDRFLEVCPGRKFTPHPVASG